MNVFLTSFSVLFLAELADKTQFLAFYLSHKYETKKVVPLIFLSIFVLKFIQSIIGYFIGSITPLNWLKIIASLFFIGIGTFILFSNQRIEQKIKLKKSHHLFLLILGAYFFAELGDKSEISTLILAARSRSIIPETLGSTLGMFIADLIAVFLGMYLKEKFSERLMKYISGTAFLVIGLFMLINFH